MQTASAFGQVQSSLSWFVNSFDTLAPLEGHRRPADRFLGGYGGDPGRRRRPSAASTSPDGRQSALELDDVEVALPERPGLLLDDVDLVDRAGSDAW